MPRVMMGVLYPILRFLYGATERPYADSITLCPGQIMQARLTDAIGTIRFVKCNRCGSLRITSSDGQGRRWGSTYAHAVLDPLRARSVVRLCRGDVRSL